MDLGLLFWMFVGARRMRGHDRWSRARLLGFQGLQLDRVRADALAASPFYRRHHASRAGEPFETLPTVTKAMVMSEFDDLVTDPRVRLATVRAHVASGDPAPFLGRYRLLLTSGTTGEPGVFVFDRRAWVSVLASFARSNEMAGCDMRVSRRIRTAAVASNSASSVSRQLATSFSSWWVQLALVDAPDPVAILVERLNAWQPQMIVAYASVARALAQEQRAGRLAIRPRWVFTTAEVLTPGTRRLIADAWGAPPFNRYTTSETGDLAVECLEGRRMHLTEDTTVVEAVDEEGRPVLPGTWSAKVLVTPLGNRVQPLIRYELSDQIRLTDEPCPCGRPFRVVDGIRGRAEEWIRLPALVGEGAVQLHGFIFEFAIDDLPISGYQVVFEDDDRIRVRLERHRGAFDEPAFVARFEQTLREHGARPPRIEVEHVTNLERSLRGKTPPLIDRRTGSSPLAEPSEGS